jgi:hypothetical protein
MSRKLVAQDHLAEADRYIAAGEEHLNRQVLLIDERSKAGQDTADAESLLYGMRVVVQAWRDHRALVLEELARHDKSMPASAIAHSIVSEGAHGTAFAPLS